MDRLAGLVDGEHYFDTFAEGAIFESRSLPWLACDDPRKGQFDDEPVRIRRRADSVMAAPHRTSQ